MTDTIDNNLTYTFENLEDFRTLGALWPIDIEELHDKFGVREAVAVMPVDKLKAFLEFRIKFLQEELDEMKNAENMEDVTDALIDLCVVAIGTMDALQINPYTAWKAVHAANMAKEIGIKDGRPNPLGLPDLVKPAGWIAPSHAGNIGLLAKFTTDKAQ